MWKWDQGRLQYFQYDELRNVARFIVEHDLKNSSSSFIRMKTGLPFSPNEYTPWRNYSRVYKMCLLVYEQEGIAVPTTIARMLSQPGVITCDEYVHFLVEATTSPAPCLADWRRIDTSKQLRSPLCFSLKYVLAKVAGLNEYITPINEIIGAYIRSNFFGDESDEEYLGLLKSREFYQDFTAEHDCRQARESIKFMTQISYLHNTGSDIIVSLSQEDAHEIFHAIRPIPGPHKADGDAEIVRLSNLFKGGSDHDFFDYSGSMISDVIDSGFNEGTKVKKTHIVIERNSKLRGYYFEQFPSAVCDACEINTSLKYPWAERVLDLHHILPLSSGTRVGIKGTILDDLAPICPTCHRAIHRFYDTYLKNSAKKDFTTNDEARDVYNQAKRNIHRGEVNA